MAQVPWTIMDITGEGVPEGLIGEFARRGIVMTLTMIDQAKRARRNINGVLRSTSKPQFDKFAGTISCTDHESPRFAALLVNKIVNLKCVAELGTHGENTDGSPEQLLIVVMIRDWGVNTNEAGAEVGWSLVWEQV
jgi:hypothetical protein